MALYISAMVMSDPLRLTASNAASFITFASSAPVQSDQNVKGQRLT